MDAINNTTVQSPLEPEIFIDGFKTRKTLIENSDSRFLMYMQDNQRIYDIIERQFRCGYCWHFAHMLKNVFNRGEVCWAAPFSHIVWVDTDKIAYDIEGKYISDALYFIPESYLGDYVNSFKHISWDIDIKYSPSKKDLIEIMKKYCDDNNIVYDSTCERWFKNGYRY